MVRLSAYDPAQAQESRWQGGATDHWDRVVAAGQCRINWSDDLYWKKSTFFTLSIGKYGPILTFLVEKVSLYIDMYYIFQLGRVFLRADYLHPPDFLNT